MSERRVPQIVSQRNGFDQIGVKIQKPADGAGNLRHAQGVQNAAGQLLVQQGNEINDLGFTGVTTKRPAVKDAVAIQRERRTELNALLFFMTHRSPVGRGERGKQFCFRLVYGAGDIV